MRGDCSIRIGGLGFSAEEIADCAQRQGLLSIEIELSNLACNCTACNASINPQTPLSTAELLSLFDQARGLGARRVILIDHATDPYAHLQSLIAELFDRQMEIELLTGATSITPELAKFLVDHHVKVELNGTSFQPAINHLMHAGAAIDGPPPIALRINVDRQNIKSVPELWQLARSHHIDPHVQIITPNNSAPPDATPGTAISAVDLPNSTEIRQLFERLAEIDRSLGITWPNPPALTGRSCKRHLFAVHLGACGTVYACVGVTIPLGTIRTESLREIVLLSEVLEDLRAFDQKLKEPCRTCSKTTDCYGCRGSAYQLTGNYMAGDELCWKADGIPIESLPVSVKGFIPHGPSIRMVDDLTRLLERRVFARFTVKADSQFVDENGFLDELAGIEIIAQAFAASHGFHLTPEQLTAHRGMLLGITNFSVSGRARVGDTLEIEVRKVTRFGEFGIVDGDVRNADGTLIATLQVKVWRPADGTGILPTAPQAASPAINVIDLPGHASHPKQ